MSADNTIGILVTRNRSGEGVEFRVAHVQAIENLVCELDYPSPKPVLSREYARRLFGDAPYFTDANAAMRYAFKLERKCEYVEYGVRLLDYSTIFFPASDRKRRRRHRAVTEAAPQAVAS